MGLRARPRSSIKWTLPYWSRSKACRYVWYRLTSSVRILCRKGKLRNGWTSRVCVGRGRSAVAAFERNQHTSAFPYILSTTSPTCEQSKSIWPLSDQRRCTYHVAREHASNVQERPMSSFHWSKSRRVGQHFCIFRSFAHTRPDFGKFMVAFVRLCREADKHVPLSRPVRNTNAVAVSVSSTAAGTTAFKNIPSFEPSSLSTVLIAKYSPSHPLSIQVPSLLIRLPEHPRLGVGVLTLPLLAEQPVDGARDDEQGSDVYSVIDHC